MPRQNGYERNSMHIDDPESQDFLLNTQSQSNIQQQSNAKRRIEENAENRLTPKRVKPETLESNLLKCDPEKFFEIHKYIHQYNEDVLVKEYADLFLNNNNIMQPIIMKEEDIQECLKYDSISPCADKTYDSIIHLFLLYFQVFYFNHNVMQATNNNVHMINPITNFWIPQFQLLPMSILSKFTEIKQSFAILMQSTAAQGTDFTCELLLLRIIDTIIQDLRSRSETSILTEVVEYHFSIGYAKAKMEFKKNYGEKKIEWDKKSSKIRHSIPSWRKSSPNEQPKDLKSWMGRDISKRILEKKEKLHGVTVNQEFEKFLSEAVEAQEDSKQKQLHRNRKKFFKDFSKAKFDKNKNKQKEKSKNNNNSNNSKSSSSSSKTTKTSIPLKVN